MARFSVFGWNTAIETKSQKPKPIQNNFATETESHKPKTKPIQHIFAIKTERCKPKLIEIFFQPKPKVTNWNRYNFSSKLLQPRSHKSKPNQIFFAAENRKRNRKSQTETKPIRNIFATETENIFCSRNWKPLDTEIFL